MELLKQRAQLQRRAFATVRHHRHRDVVVAVEPPLLNDDRDARNALQPALALVAAFALAPAEPRRGFAGSYVLEGLIGTFPFITKADQSVALAAMLTTLDRRAMATAPLFAFNSPVAGTGKSKLVDLCSILATGQLMSVISQGYSEEEFVKCLSAALLAGDLAISIDNCERELKSDFWCQALTQPKLNIRIFWVEQQRRDPDERLAVRHRG